MALYDSIGRGYSSLRKPDHRIAEVIRRSLGDAASVVNVGAGTGSYEPTDRRVFAVEPSEVMIRQRPLGAAPCVQGSAEAIPCEPESFDAALTVLSAHHWPDLDRGLQEMSRVAKKRVLMLTWVPDADAFWLTDDYFPEIMAYDRTVFPATSVLAAKLQRFIGPARIEPVPVPHDCADGFLGAYWRRPERYLDPQARAAISSFSRFDADPGLTRLRQDLESGRWDARYGHLRALEALDVGYRIVCCEKSVRCG